MPASLTLARLLFGCAVAVAGIAGASAVGAASVHRAAITYTAQPVTVPHAKVVGAVAIDNQGDALMRESTCADCRSTFYLWSAGTATAIPAPIGAADFEAVGLAGDAVAGVAQFIVGGDPVVRSFVATVSGGSVQFARLLDPSASADGVEATAVDGLGDILGESTGDPVQFYIWPSGTTTAQPLSLAVPGGDSYSITSLDESGDYAGTVTTPAGIELAVWPNGGAMKVVPHSLAANDATLGPPSIGGLVRTGDSVLVTGYQGPLWYAHTKAWSWSFALAGTAAKATAITTLNSSRPAVITSGVSDAGVVTGADWSPHTAVAMVVGEGTQTALKKLMAGPVKPSSYAFTTVPAGINPSGQILLGAWLLTPSP